MCPSLYILTVQSATLVCKIGQNKTLEKWGKNSDKTKQICVFKKSNAYKNQGHVGEREKKHHKFYQSLRHYRPHPLPHWNWYHFRLVSSLHHCFQHLFEPPHLPEVFLIRQKLNLFVNWMCGRPNVVRRKKCAFTKYGKNDFTKANCWLKHIQNSIDSTQNTWSNLIYWLSIVSIFDGYWIPLYIEQYTDIGWWWKLRAKIQNHHFFLKFKYKTIDHLTGTYA